MVERRRRQFTDEERAKAATAACFTLNEFLRKELARHGEKTSVGVYHDRLALQV